MAARSSRHAATHGLSLVEQGREYPIIYFVKEDNIGLGPTIRAPRQLIGITDRSGFRGLFRSIVSDLVSIERLGSLHNVITSRVCRGAHAGKFTVKGETSYWFGRNSWWKRWL
jgi:hypothetical protein